MYIFLLYEFSIIKQSLQIGFCKTFHQNTMANRDCINPSSDDLYSPNKSIAIELDFEDRCKTPTPSEQFPRLNDLNKSFDAALRTSNKRKRKKRSTTSIDGSKQDTLMMEHFATLIKWAKYMKCPISPDLFCDSSELSGDISTASEMCSTQKPKTHSKEKEIHSLKRFVFSESFVFLSFKTFCCTFVNHSDVVFGFAGGSLQCELRLTFHYQWVRPQKYIYS